MVHYCAQKLLGRHCFGFKKENQLKVDSCQLKSLLKLTILKIVEGGAQKMASYWGGATLISIQHSPWCQLYYILYIVVQWVCKSTLVTEVAHVEEHLAFDKQITSHFQTATTRAIEPPTASSSTTWKDRSVGVMMCHGQIIPATNVLYWSQNMVYGSQIRGFIHMYIYIQILRLWVKILSAQEKCLTPWLQSNMSGWGISYNRCFDRDIIYIYHLVI